MVKQLEDILGTALLVRTPKGVVPTKAGDQLYTYAKRVIQQTDEVEFTIKAGEETASGIIRIGTYDSIARYFFPDFLKYLRAIAPGVQIFLETGRSRHIIKKLKNKELDIAVIVATGSIPKTIEVKNIYTDAFGLYASPNLNAAFENKLIYFDFPQNETEVVMKNFDFVESILCDNLETVRSLTEQAIGVGLLPHRVAKESVLAKRLVAHVHPKIKSNSFDFHDIVLCHLKNETSSEKELVLQDTERFLDLWSKN